MDQNNNASSIASSIVSAWPGAFGAFKPSKDSVNISLSAVVLLLFSQLAISIVLSIVLQALLGKVLGAILNDVVSIFVGAFILSAQVYVYLSSARGKRVELNEAVKAARPFWGRMVLLEILVGLTVIGGLILLIIPGIYFGLRLSLAGYYLVDQDMGVMDAYKASWEATKGNVSKVLGIVGVMILMALPVITVIGVIATIILYIMYSATYALLYIHITKNEKTEAKSAAPKAPAGNLTAA